MSTDQIAYAIGMADGYCNLLPYPVWSDGQPMTAESWESYFNGYNDALGLGL